MAPPRPLIVEVLGVLGALAFTATASAGPAPLYTLAATQSCLTKLPNAVAGLPPTKPPVPPALFVYTLAHDDEATAGVAVALPRAHRQVGAWYGGRKYQGIILSFFKSIPDARASLQSLASLNGGERIRNVVATWDLNAPWPQKPAPSRSVRSTVFGCLRSGTAGSPAPPTRSATLATFAGVWGGHDRGFSINSRGRGGESTYAGCCMRVYRMTFQILAVNGADASYGCVSRDVL
jgi:hypothetical protein